ncbi:MAG: hypothetical protein K0R63_1851 [Rickettsiales bacterium]|jgi:flagellar motility protein MotE (MotC chaperone)|nr:hypothetical protein [Rickettsiales bacterium]
MRILSLLIVACSLLFVVKAYALFNSLTGKNVAFPVQEVLFIEDLNAQEHKASEDEKEEHGAEKKEEKTKKPAEHGGEKPAENEGGGEGDAHKAKEAADKDKHGSKPGKKTDSGEKPEKESIDPPQEIRTFSKSELDVLESLASRRKQLETWEQEIALKEKVLNSTEAHLTTKITQMEALRKTLDELLTVYNEKEDVKIRSLVKIYENMKPQDAARIFEELDMTVLLEVIDRMKESRAAPILAKMDPKRAKDITTKLAERKQIRPSDYQ